jgi:dienelactone hydrolase
MFIPRARECRIFTVAVALAVLHALDDAFLGRQAGVGLGQHALAGLISLLAGAAGIAAFPRLRPGLRATLALGFGVPALVNGAMHAAHITFDAPADSDLTGVLALGAGIVLIALGATLPLRRRHELTTTAKQRWASRALALPGGIAVAALFVVPVAMAVFETHKPRERIGAPPNAAYQRVAFDSSDGLRLKGWYRPSRNGAAILVVHGGGGDRNGAVDQARLLERHGYGVLLYDARGRGESEGSPNSYGWDWEKDAAGALDFLGDVEHGKIGVLGLSSGADTAIDVAATRDDVDAVVSDGAALRTFEDAHRLDGSDPAVATAWVMFKAIEVMSGDKPSRPLGDLVAKITAPLLLISAGSALEKDANDSYARANPSAEHWNIPAAKHTGALRSHGAAYERRVTSFLDHALLGFRDAP